MKRRASSITSSDQHTESLFERQLDLEAKTVDYNDLQLIKSNIGTHKKDLSTDEMIDRNKANHNISRTPDQIQATES